MSGSASCGGAGAAAVSAELTAPMVSDVHGKERTTATLRSSA
jgi:hypothetical protein